MNRLEHAAIDARMIAHSGIGTTLRGLLHAWKASPPPFRLTLMGPLDRLEALAPKGLEAEEVEFRAPIYGMRGMLTQAPTGRAQAILSMHYAGAVRPKAIPLVAVVHDLIHITHPTRRGSAAYMRLALARLRRRASFVVTGSRQTKVLLQTLHGFAAHRVLTVPWGPGVCGFGHPRPLDPGLLPDKPFILAVGIDKPHKNWDFLLQRLAALWKSGQLDWPLAAAGLDDAGWQRIPAMARDLGCLDRIRRIPRLDDGHAASLYREASLLAFPSLAEGFGMPLVEAMACGLPIVAADLPPMNEVAAGGAVFFDPDEPESFDRAVLAVAKDPELRAGLAAAGREAAARLNWARCAKKYEEILQRAVGDPR